MDKSKEKQEENSSVRLCDDDIKYIKKLIESGKRDPAFYLSDLCNRFPEYSASTYSDWTKKLYGVAGGQYFTDAGAVMNEDQRIEYTRNILNSLKNRTNPEYIRHHSHRSRIRHKLFLP